MLLSSAILVIILASVNGVICRAVSPDVATVSMSASPDLPFSNP